jgi:hypothetical protein
VSGATRPQAVGTQSDAWLWQWRTFEGLGGAVEHEFELEWLRTERRWQVRSSYDRAGWCTPLAVTTLDDPDSYEHAERLAHEYADRPRGG